MLVLYSIIYKPLFRIITEPDTQVHTKQFSVVDEALMTVLETLWLHENVTRVNVVTLSNNIIMLKKVFINICKTLLIKVKLNTCLTGESDAVGFKKLQAKFLPSSYFVRKL